MLLPLDKIRRFKLSEGFLGDYATREVAWGYNGLGYVVYKRTYSRDGEEWWQTVQRVVEGVYNIQKAHCFQLGLPWDNRKAQRSAQIMYDLIFNFKFLPSGRGLYNMGADFLWERGSAALYNCAFVSTESIDSNLAEPFSWAMSMLAHGVGVGSDTRGAGKVRIQEPRVSSETHVIADSREGWVDAVHRVLDAFVGKGALPERFDYSQIRPKGAPLKTFGGTASGPEPLRELIDSLIDMYSESVGEMITSTLIVDTMNMMGRCIVSGGIRRSAEIMLGNYRDQEFLNLKNPELHKEELMDWRWASNNSILAEMGMDYSDIARRTAINGEPGYVYMENIHNFGRMIDPPDKNDSRASGINPCFSEDTLIAVADGRGAVAISTLADEGRDVPVYSMNPEGMVEIKWGRNPRVTGTECSLIEIEFDNGKTLKVTPNHKIALYDGGYVEASELKIGDRVPRLTKRKEKISKSNPNRYIRVNTNTRDSRKDKIYEHRLIARFYKGDEWDKIYDEEKRSGWVEGGLVVHHIDYDSLNNSPDNLQIMTFRAHSKLHGSQDNSGEKNPMWGRSHSQHTKDLIGTKAKKRWADTEYKQRWIDTVCTPEYRAERSKHARMARIRSWENYYKEMERTTDLETFWKDKSLWVIKYCENCGTSFERPWLKREIGFCSNKCVSLGTIEHRLANQARAFEDKARKNLHRQVLLFHDMREELGRDPKVTEWKGRCKDNSISYRFNRKSKNPHIMHGWKEFKEYAMNYNHRVVGIRKLEGGHTVYNITVDDNHTVAIALDEEGCDGVFTPQCGEIPLESFELCNLVESFPAHHDSPKEYMRTLKYAYLYAKSVTLLPSHSAKTNAVQMKNRRIGVSQSGIQQSIIKHGYHAHFHDFCDAGYKYLRELDEIYSDWLCVPRSIRVTTVKPSGSISLLCGATPGIHFPHSEFYIRRLRVRDSSPIVEACKEAGYEIEEDLYADNTVVISFPVKEHNFYKGKEDASMWEQLSCAAKAQEYWSDNAVSSTITFNKEEALDLPRALEVFEDKLKSVSFLPLEDHGYEQAPYETITEEQYIEMVSRLKPLELRTETHEVTEKFCDGDTCTIG